MSRFRDIYSRLVLRSPVDQMFREGKFVAVFRETDGYSSPMTARFGEGVLTDFYRLESWAEVEGKVTVASMGLKCALRECITERDPEHFFRITGLLAHACARRPDRTFAKMISPGELKVLMDEMLVATPEALTEHSVAQLALDDLHRWEAVSRSRNHGLGDQGIGPAGR
ncbi:MAG: hypothetical protein ACOYN3_08795 [Acidimicrobiia bacterium]